MTITEQRQAAKGKAFNDILKIYHPKSQWRGCPYDREMSYREQKEYDVKRIMETYFEELNAINAKLKQKIKTK